MPDIMSGVGIASAVGGLAGAGMSIFGGGSDSGAINDAMDNQIRMQQQSLALKQQMYDQTVARMAPWTTAGQRTIPYISGILNIPGYDKIDPTGAIRSTPAYGEELRRGVDARDLSASSRGNLYSQAHLKDLTSYGQYLADQKYNNYMGNLFKVSDTGQSAAGLVSNIGQNYANSAGADYNSMGNVMGAGGIAQYNAEQANQNNLFKSLGMLGGGAGLAAKNYFGGGSSAPSYSYTPPSYSNWNPSVNYSNWYSG